MKSEKFFPVRELCFDVSLIWRQFDVDEKADAKSSQISFANFVIEDATIDFDSEGFHNI